MRSAPRLVSTPPVEVARRYPWRVVMNSCTAWRCGARRVGKIRRYWADHGTTAIAVTVALHAAADHGAVEHAERGEQGGGAVPLVVVCHGLAAPGLDRQSGLDAVESLDLTLFIDRKHRRGRLQD